MLLHFLWNICSNFICNIPITKFMKFLTRFAIFINASTECFWPKKIQISCKGSKVPFWKNCKIAKMALLNPCMKFEFFWAKVFFWSIMKIAIVRIFICTVFLDPKNRTIKLLTKVREPSWPVSIHGRSLLGFY